MRCLPLIQPNRTGDVIDVSAPSGKVPLIGSGEVEAWVVEHCQCGVSAHLDDAGRFVLTFDVAAEAEASHARWIAPDPHDQQ